MLTVQTFATEEEAVAMANDTRFGLAATLVTGDPERAERVSARLNAGTVWVNCFFVRDLGAPFGGNGKSGIGREGGDWSFDFYCDIKNTVFSPTGWTVGLREDGRLMGEVVGAGLIAHVPTIVLPEATRRELNDGEDITLVAGLQQLRREVFDTLDYDTVVVLDSHWATTVEFVVTAQERRAGLFTSEELPRGMTQRPYDFPGDPELAHLIASKARRARHLDHRDRGRPPADLLRHHQRVGVPRRRACPTSGGSRIGVCQTADIEDNLRLGRALGDAIAESDRKVLLIASGAMSHTFWPLRQLRDHEAAGLEHIFTQEAAAADAERIEWFKQRRPRPGARHDAGVLPLQARGPVRPLPDDDRRPRRGRLHRDRPPVRRVRELDRHRPGAPLVRPPRGRVPPRPGVRRPTPTTSARPAGPRPAGRRLTTRNNDDHRERPAGSCSTATPSTSYATARPWSPATAARSPIADATHLPPVTPSKIVCVHLNYPSRVEEMMTTLPPAPTYFHKPVSALNAHEGAVVRPEGCKWLNYEGEIAIVIGRTARNIAPEEAGDYIRGYTIGNDYGLHDFRDTDSGSMLRVKGADTLCPLGPGLVEGWDFHDKQIRTHRQRRGAPGRQHRRDGVGHALPRRRHRPHHHAAARRRAAVRHAGDLPHGLPGRRRRGRGRGPRHAAQPHRRGPDARSAPTSAPSPPRARRCSPPPRAATGSSAASASPTSARPTEAA